MAGYPVNRAGNPSARPATPDAKSPSLLALKKSALSHWAAGRRTEAIAAFRNVLKLAPESADAHHDLGAALLGVGQVAEAAERLERAAGLRPSYEAALHKLASAQEHLGRDSDAATTYRRLAKVAGSGTERRLFQSKALILDGAADEAEAELRRALAVNPGNAGAHVLLGQLLLEKGAFAEGAHHLGQAVDKFPDAFQHLAGARRMTEEDRPLVERMVNIAGRPTLDPIQGAAVHFGLGKALDDLGDYERAMHHYDAANAIRAAAARLDRTGLVELHDALIKRFDAPTLARRTADPREASELPVLIVGMPRSGTTLVEQILSSHPEVAAGGELPFWNERLAAMRAPASGAGTAPSPPTPDPLTKLLASRPASSLVEQVARQGLGAEKAPTWRFDPEALRSAAAEYLDLLRGIGPAASRVTDKAPMNFERLGLIHAVLPHARIIHCRRDPVDTCLSIFFTNYKGRQSWTRADLVFHYRQYLRIMAHWRAVLPADRFIEVDYADMVGDRDAQSRRLIAFCGLAWDDACLVPEANTRLVRTASLWQARQPTYTRSLERWRRYEPWLGELRDLHDDAIG